MKKQGRTEENRRRRIKAALFFMLCLFFLLAAAPVDNYTANYENTPRISQERMNENLSISVTYGWKDMDRYASKLPMQIRIKNDGEPFSGKLKVVTATDGNTGWWIVDTVMDHFFVSVRSATDARNQQYTYEFQTEIDAKETAEKKFLLAINQYGKTTVDFILETQAGEEVCRTTEVIAERHDEANLIAAVLESSTSCAEKLDRTSFYNFTWEALSVTEADLTEEMVQANMPDVLILLEKGERELSPEKKEILRRWQDKGGVLIDLNGEAYGGRYSDTGKMLRRLFMENPEETMKILVQEDAFFYTELREGGEGNRYEMAYTLEQLPVRKQPGSLLFVSLMVGYALLAGPVLYIFMKKKNMRYHLWKAGCLLAVLFVVLIQLLGSPTAMTAPVLLYQRIIKETESAQKETVQKDQIGFEIQAPFNAGYNLYLDTDYTLSANNVLQGEGDEHDRDEAEYEQIHILYGEDKNEVRFDRLPAFALNGFSMKKEQKTENGGLETDFQWKENGTVGGSITNHTGYEIRACVLQLPGHLVNIGSIEEGQTIILADAKADSVGSSLTWLKKQFDEATVKSLQVIINNNMPTELSDSCVTALLEDETAGGFQLGSGYDLKGDSFYIADANVSNITEEGNIYCAYASNLNSVKYADSMSLAGNGMEVEYYLNAAHEIEDRRERTIRLLLKNVFHDPENMESIIEAGTLQEKLEYMTDMMQRTETILAWQPEEILCAEFLNVKYVDEQLAVFDGNIEIYNFRTKTFELPEDWKLEEEFENNGVSSPYLSGNKLRVRFTREAKEEEVQTDGEWTVYELPELHVTLRPLEQMEEKWAEELKRGTFEKAQDSLADRENSYAAY